ncbi:hypothetical protein D3C72_2252350 [compost metagenome]
MGLGNLQQGGAATLFGRVQFQLHLLDVQQLLLQLQTPFGDLAQHDLELVTVVALRVVQLDQGLAFGQGEANALAAQNQL